MVALYDVIGGGYDTGRRPDPRIAERIVALMSLPAGSSVLDLGCGTGNYTSLLRNAAYRMVGIDLSDRMLGAAQGKDDQIAWVCGTGELLPFPDRVFDGVMTTLTLHHMRDLAHVFKEVRRVLRGSRFVFFTALPEQMEKYWLGVYWPRLLAEAVERMPSRQSLSTALAMAGFNRTTYESWDVPPDLSDLFWYAGKDRPEIYFDPAVRSGISAFAELGTHNEIESGLVQLRGDLNSGRWQQIRAESRHDSGDYSFGVAITES